MVLAMPVQAFAAATMLFCGLAHERMFGGVSPADGGVHAARHGGLPAGRDAGHAEVADATAAHEHHALAGHDHGDHASPTHDHAGHASATHRDHDHAAHHTTVAQGASDADTASGATTDLGSFTCSACAACCSMLGMPASIAFVGAADRVDTVASGPAPEVHWFVIDSLDRPPRAQPV